MTDEMLKAAALKLKNALSFMKKEYDLPKEACGYTMGREAFAELTGLDPHPKAFELTPTGARVVVAVQPRPKDYGLIQLPDSAMHEMSGRGWIIAVGPDAADPAAYPGAPRVNDASDLLGMHCYFGHAGQPLRLGLHDTQWEAPLQVLTARDIWLIDHRPWNDPWRMEADGE